MSFAMKYGLGEIGVHRARPAKPEPKDPEKQKRLAKLLKTRDDLVEALCDVQVLIGELRDGG